MLSSLSPVRHRIPSLGFFVLTCMLMALVSAYAAGVTERWVWAVWPLVFSVSSLLRALWSTLDDAAFNIDRALVAARAAIVVLHCRSRRLYWRGAFEGMFGYDPGKFPGTIDAWAQRVHPEDVERLRRLTAASDDRRRHRDFREICRVQSIDGTTRWVEACGAAIYNRSGQPRRMDGILADVSDRVKAEADLARSNRRYEMASSLVPALIYEIEFATGTVTFSAGLARVLGFAPHELTASEEWWLSRVHEEDAARVRHAKDELAAIGAALCVEYRIQHRDGRHVHVIDRATAEMEGDRVVRIVGTAEDISARKAAELALERARAEAEAANRAKSYLVAHVSHEIRSPLGTVLGYADLLSDERFGAPDRCKFIAAMKRSADALNRIIDDVLDFSKIEAGHLDLHAAKVSVTEIVEDVVGAFGACAAAKGLKLTYDLNGLDALTIETDPTRLGQVLNNLVGNAVKYTNAGAVSLRVELVGGGSRRHLSFTVADTGPGLSESACDSVFDSFSRGDMTNLSSPKGTGLGLTLSRKIARAMGGDVELTETCPGKGSTFRAFVPTKLENAMA